MAETTAVTVGHPHVTLVTLGVADVAAGGHPTIALRCPSHPLALKVLQLAWQQGVKGVAAPSANVCGVPVLVPRLAPLNVIDPAVAVSVEAPSFTLLTTAAPVVSLPNCTFDPVPVRLIAPELAVVLVDIIGRLDALFDEPMPYMLWIHQRPFDGVVRRALRVHVHIAPLSFSRRSHWRYHDENHDALFIMSAQPPDLLPKLPAETAPMMYGGSVTTRSTIASVGSTSRQSPWYSVT